MRWTEQAGFLPATSSRKKPQMKKRRLTGCLLSVIILCAAVFFIPSGLRWAINRAWSLYRSVSGLPVSGGRVTSVSWNGLRATGFVLQTAPDMTVQVDEIAVNGSLFGLLNQTVDSVTGRLSGGGRLQLEGRFAVDSVERLANGLNARLSARFNPVVVGPLRTGSFELAGQWRGANAFLSADVPLFDGLLTAAVRAEMQGAPGRMGQGTVRIPFAAPGDGAVALDGVHPALAGVAAQGELLVDASGRDGKTSIAVEADFTRIESPERRIRLDGLTTRCALDFSGAFRSLPEQTLTLKRLTAGGIQIENLKVDYQLEPGGVLFLESLSADWCDGRISLFNTRCGVDRRDVSLKVFCDRLSLEQVLGAFGLDGVSVGGELNGSLPVRLDGLSVEVDHGFLYTTPGRGGTLTFDTPETVEHLLPAQSLQAGQLGMVSAALADFEYDWITMTLNSVDESLRVSMEVSGRPAQPLPYAYDERRQAYVRIADDQTGTRRPMRFTFNLNVPFNQLLWYASRADKTWKQMRAP